MVSRGFGSFGEPLEILTHPALVASRLQQVDVVGQFVQRLIEGCERLVDVAGAEFFVAVVAAAGRLPAVTGRSCVVGGAMAGPRGR
jgi:hypothetical protein